MRRKIDEAGVPAGLKLVQEMALRRLLTDERLNAQQVRNFYGFVARRRQRRKIPALVLRQIGIANDDAAHLAIPQRPDFQGQAKQRLHVRQEHQGKPIDQPFSIELQRRKEHKADVRDGENDEPLCARALEL